MTYWNVILFAVIPDHSHGRFLTDPFSALVPDPADGQDNGKDFDFHCSSRHKTEKEINILTYTAGRMASMGSADTRQAGSPSMQGIVKLLHLVFCISYI